MNEISEKVVEVAAKAMANGAWDILDEHIQSRYLVMARAALTAALPHVVGWQPIETAPKDGTHILLGYFGGHVEQGYWMSDATRNYWGETGWYAADEEPLHTNPSQPTHWMPLPPAPTNPERGDG